MRVSTGQLFVSVLMRHQGTWRGQEEDAMPKTTKGTRCHTTTFNKICLLVHKKKKLKVGTTNSEAVVSVSSIAPCLQITVVLQKKKTENKDSYQVNNHKNQCWIEEIKTPRDIKAHMMDRHISKVVDVRGGGGHTRSFFGRFPHLEITT